ncbi:hypothetical protein SLE2022_104040 [Rubroshorea leprosula]
MMIVSPPSANPSYLKDADMEQIMPTSTIPSNADIVSRRESSICKSLAQQQQCLFVQTILNGINVLFGMGLLTTDNSLCDQRKWVWLSLILLVMSCSVSCLVMLEFY